MIIGLPHRFSALTVSLAMLLSTALAAQESSSHADHSPHAMQHDHPQHTIEHKNTPLNPQPAPREPLPEITPADLEAAFPAVGGHDMHDQQIHSYLLINRFEMGNEKNHQAWEAQGWIGGDIHKLWVRSDGERSDSVTEAANIELLYGKSIARWWDLLAGVRHEFKPHSSQSDLAVGVIGMAPQKFDIEATAYLGQDGQSALQLEAEYELLLTNRWILQPLLAFDIYGKNRPSRGIGRGLSSTECGLRLRYEIHRQFAPYVGFVAQKAFAETANLRERNGESVTGTRWVAGIRAWF